MGETNVATLVAVMRLRDELSDQLAKVQGALGGIRENTQRTAESVGSFERAMTVAATVGTFLGNVLYDLARGAIRLLWGEFQRAIDLSAEFTNSFIGLQSIALAFGVDADAARAAAESLASDGLMKVSEAAQGLKNLLMSGFNLDQSIQLMNAFKDSAAFGRQASLDFGHAVVTATEGIKNQNSILVDNAGVTKNLTIILKEAGFSVQDLSRVSTDARVRLALFNGILKETAAMAGDAERLTQTYTGQVSRLTTQYEFLLGTLGSAITENKTVATVIGLVADAVQDLNDDLVNQGKAFTLISDIIIGFVRGLALLVEGINFVAQGFLYAGTFVQAFMYGTAQAGQAIDGFLLKTLQGIAKIPGATTVISGLGAAIEALQYDYLSSGAKAFHYGEALDASGIRAQAFSDFSHTLSGRLNQVADELEKTRGQTIEFGARTRTTRDDVQGLGEELSETAKKVKALTDELGGQKAIQSAEQWTEAVRQIGGVTRLSAEDQAKYNKILGESLEAHRRLAIEVPPGMLAAFEATSKWREELYKLEHDSLRSLPTAMEQVWHGAGETELRMLDAALAADKLHVELVNLERGGASQVTGAIGNIGNAAGDTELAILGMRGELEKLKLKQHAEAVLALHDAFQNLGGAIGGQTGQLVSDFGGLATSLLGVAGASTKFLEGTGAIIQGIANVWSAVGGDQSQGMSALSGAMAGLQAGLDPKLMALTGGWSAAIGAGAGALAGWLAAQSGPTREELLKAQEMVREWSQSVAGYFDDVASAADRFRVGTGDAARTTEIVTRAYTDFGLSAQLAEQNLRALANAQRHGPEAVERVLTIVTAQIERHQAVMRAWTEGVNQYLDGFTTRVEGFGMHADRLRQIETDLNKAAVDGRKAFEQQEELVLRLKASGTATQDEIIAAVERLHEIYTQSTSDQIEGNEALNEGLKSLQREFEILQQYAVTAFSVTLSQSGSLIEAFRQIQGPLDELIALQEEFGLEGSAAYERLREISGVISAHEDIFTSLDGLNQMMLGLHEATLLTHDDMRLFGLDAVDLFEQMRQRGIDADFAMASMQPTLQMLWEWQRKYGLEVDETTQALIDQAVEAGVVGEEQRGVHERMVAAIQLVEAAILRLPEAFAQALQGARDLRYELDEIARIPGAPGMSVEVIYTGGTATPRTEHDGGFVYHEGGYIPRAHSGMFLGKRLAADEVPIIAQTGEAVLNRAATAAVGGESGVNALNRGGAIGGGGTGDVFHLGTVTVYANDPQEFVDGLREVVRTNRGGIRSDLEKMLVGRRG